MDLKKIFIYVLMLTLAYIAGRQSGPKEIKEVKVIETVEVKTTDVVADLNNSLKKNVVVVESEEVSPDGTIKRQKTTTDLSQNETSVLIEQKIQEAKKQKEILVVEKKNKSQWIATVSYGIDKKGVSFGGDISTRFLDLPVFVGVGVLKNSQQDGVLTFMKLGVEW